MTIFASMEDVKVRFPNGRVTWMPRKTAQSMYVVQMGGFIVEQEVKVPKRFAPIIVEPEEVTPEPDTRDEEWPTEEAGYKTTKKRKPRSDKGTKHAS